MSPPTHNTHMPTGFSTASITISMHMLLIALESLRSVTAEVMFYTAWFMWMSGPLLVLHIELLKLVVSGIVVLATARNIAIRELYRSVLPGVLHVAGNLLYFEVLRWRSAALIAVMINMRLPLIVALVSVVNKQSLSRVGAISIFLMTAGTIITQINARFSYDTVWAICMCILISACWVASPVLFKKNLTQTSMSFWEQQIHQSLIGTLASLIAVSLYNDDLFRAVSDSNLSRIVAYICIVICAALGLVSHHVETPPVDFLERISPVISSLLSYSIIYFIGKFYVDQYAFLIGIGLVIVGAIIYASKSPKNTINKQETKPIPLSEDMTMRASWFVIPDRKSLALIGLVIIQTLVILSIFIWTFSTNPFQLEAHDVSSQFKPIDFGSKHLCFVDPRNLEHKTKIQTGTSVVHDIEEECRLAMPLAIKQCPVPKVIHLVVIGGNYQLYHYLAVKSIHDKIKPNAIFIHGYKFPIKDEYFKRIINDFKPILVESRSAEDIYGNPAKLFHHRSDFIRIESIIRFGGIYFDLDVFVLKDMDKYLNDEAVMGEQPRHGINSGMLIGKRCARFFRRWHSGYSNFNDSLWDEHAIRLPGRLYHQDRSDLRLEGDALRNVWPSKYMFDKEYDPNPWKSIRAIHSFYRDYGKTHNFEDVKTLKNNYGIFARNLLYDGPELGE